LLLIVVISSISDSAYGALLQTFYNPTPGPEYDFGIYGGQIAISGNNVLVGAHREDTVAEDAGSAYLFDTSGNLLQIFNNPTPMPKDRFGISVAISGNKIVVGAHQDDTGKTNAGSAYLFDTSGNLLQTFNNPTPMRGDLFGDSVAIYENIVVVGAHRDDTGAENAGSVYLFDTSGNLLQTINNPTPVPEAGFGEKVAIYGNKVVVGAYHDNAGFAYLFDTSGNLLQTFHNPTPVHNDQFGKSVSIFGNKVVVGAHTDDTGATNAGSAYLFDTSGNLLQIFNNPTPMPNEQFGHTVAIYGNKVVVGAYRDNTGAENAGSAYLFNASGNLLQTINNPTPMSGDAFSHEVSISETYVLISAHIDNTEAENYGLAYLFEHSKNPLPFDQSKNPLPFDQSKNPLPSDSTNLLLSDIQTSVVWIIPVISAVGIGWALTRRKKSNFLLQ